MSLRPGTSIDLHYLNALSERARRGNMTVAGDGLTAQDSPGGMIFNQDGAAESLPNCMRMQYNPGSTAGTLFPYSLVHIYGFGGLDIGGNGGVGFDVPDYSGRRMLGILREGALPGDCAMVQYQGIAPLLFDLNTLNPLWISDPAFPTREPVTPSGLRGRRLGARARSPFAQWDQNGPLLIDGTDGIDWGAFDASDPESPYPILVTARFDMPFGTQVYCEPVSEIEVGGVIQSGNVPVDFSGAYRVLHFGPMFNVQEVAPGDITI